MYNIVVDNANKDICYWVVEKSGGTVTEGATAIGVEKDGFLQVGIMYQDYTGIDGSITMFSRCDNPKATSKEFYRAIFDYPFGQLKVNRCTVMVNEHNIHAIELNERLGFKREATLTHYFPDGDALILKMIKNECKWLKEKQ